MPRRLRETVIEISLAPAADVRDGSVENHLLPLVDVEALVHEVMNEPSRLRDAERIGPFDCAGQRISLPLGVLFDISQKADDIANRGKPQPRDARIDRRVNQLIQPAGTKSFF